MSEHAMARHDGGPTESTATRRAVAAGDAQGARPLPALAAGSGARLCHRTCLIGL